MTEEELASRYGHVVQQFLEAISDASEFVNFVEHVGECCSRIDTKRAKAEAKRIPVNA